MLSWLTIAGMKAGVRANVPVCGCFYSPHLFTETDYPVHSSGAAA